jgi:hypothetical protein
MFDGAGRLLYIGQSVSLAERLGAHRHGSGWWSDVRTITVEPHADLLAVRAAESAAILAERPIHNVSGRPTQNDQVARNARCRARRLGLESAARSS